MNGKNTLKLNQESMLEVAQLWIDSELTTKVRVTAVRQIAPTGYGQETQPMYYEIDVDTNPQGELPPFVKGSEAPEEK